MSVSRVTHVSRARDRGVQAVTILDVAVAAGTSPATVSRVLNGRRSAADDVSERVRAAARSLGYSPNIAAQSLRQARVPLIGMLVSDLLVEPLVASVRAAQMRAQQRGYSTIIVDAQSSEDVAVDHLHQLLAQRIAGLLIVGPSTVPLEHLQGAATAGVVIAPDAAWAGRLDGERRSTEQHAIDDAVSQLVASGHRWIAPFGLPGRGTSPAESVFDVRTRLLASAAEWYGCRFEATAGTRDIAEMTGLARRLVSSGERGAIFSLSHLDLAPTLSALRDAGANVPADVSLITFGDSAWAQAWTPPISVIARDMAAEAERFVDGIVALIEGSGDVPFTFSRAEFIARASTPLGT